ncbi:MAG: hypothetical protein ACE37F_22460 [Nannocystaceae bacterium]|nr:hypothetical protein [bacterium]
MHAALLSVLAAVATNGPRVHIEVERGPSPVALVAREAQRNESRGLRRVDTRHEAVCESPCDAVVAVDAPAFFIAGADLMPSTNFNLPPQGEVTVRVRGGRRSSFLAGWVLAGLGAPVLIGGTVAMTLADDDQPRLRTGAVVASAGASLVLTGAILVATGRTRIRIERGAPDPRR